MAKCIDSGLSVNTRSCITTVEYTHHGRVYSVECTHSRGNTQCKYTHGGVYPVEFVNTPAWPVVRLVSPRVFGLLTLWTGWMVVQQSDLQSGGIICRRLAAIERAEVGRRNVDGGGLVMDTPSLQTWRTMSFIIVPDRFLECRMHSSVSKTPPA